MDVCNIGGLKVTMTEATMIMRAHDDEDLSYTLGEDSPAWMRTSTEMMVISGVLERDGSEGKWWDEWSLSEAGAEFMGVPGNYDDIKKLADMAAASPELWSK
jgi:hypothetical protein